jgi:hypothetical protein
MARHESAISDSRGSDSITVAPGGTPDVLLLRQLQSTGGNQMVLRLLSAGNIQDDDGADAIAGRIRAKLGGGEPLAGDVRAAMEQGIGQPLPGDIRLHRGGESASLAGQLGARAFTTGSDVFFGANAYDPSTRQGQAVLAHELVHTLQPSTAGGHAGPLAVSDPGDRDEREASAVAARVVAGHPAELASTAPRSRAPQGDRAVAVQRCGDHVSPGCACADELESLMVHRSPDGDANGPAQPADKYELPPGSPYAGLGGPLLDLLRTSYRDREDGKANSERNVDNAYWGGHPENFGVVLDRLGTAGIELVREIADRSGPAFMAKVRYVKNLWSGTSRGFEFVTNDLAGLEALAAATFCRDTPTGESEHKPARCYREMVSGSHGVHWVLHESAGTSVHIDLHQTVKKKDPDGTCAYSYWSLPAHWSDVFLNLQDESPFEKFDRVDHKLAQLRAQLATMPPDDENVVRSMAELPEIQARMDVVRTRARELAARGAPGEESARTDLMPQIWDLLDRVYRIDFRINPPTPDYSMMP